MGSFQESGDTRKLAQARRIIDRLLRTRQEHQALTQRIARFERRYGYPFDTLLDEKTPTKSVPFPVYQKVQRRLQFLRSSQYKPTERLVIDEAQCQIEHPQKVDADGYIRFNYQTAAKHINMSSSTPKRSIQAVLEQSLDYPLQCKWDVPEVTQDGKKIECLYIKPTVPDLVAASMTRELEHKRKQGGNQYECQRCHSINVMIERRLTCLDCGHTSLLEPSYPNGRNNNSGKSVKSNLLLTDMPVDTANTAYSDRATPSENFLTDGTQPVGMVITSYPPLVAGNLPTPTAADLQEEAATIISAAEFLLKVAGQDEKHITMPRRHEKKYLEIKRPLDRSDLVEHLRGGEAKGALCAYQDGSTYALVWDTDESDSWDAWKLLAHRLVQAGYMVLFDESPAGRGGHLLILFDGRVDAAAARAAVLQIAPELVACREYWPGGTTNRVRLPGAYYARCGKYVEHPVEAWCSLFNASTGEMARDGVSAARLLLSSMTPATMVPALPAISAQDEPAALAPFTQDEPEAPACIVLQQEWESGDPPAALFPQSQGDELEASTMASSGPDTLLDPEVDAQWEARYGKIETTTCWFAIMPDVAAAWYNKQNPLESIRPRERNKMALSPNGEESTASTGYYDTDQGERWTDFSQHGRREDGTHESGDAFELAARLEGISKSAFLARVIGDMISQGKAALESAARAGQPLPSWFFEPKLILTRAGRRQYAKRVAEIQGEACEQEHTVTSAAVTIDEQQPEPEAATLAALVPELPSAGKLPAPAPAPAVLQHEQDRAEGEQRDQAAEFEEWKRTHPEDYRALLARLNTGIQAELAEKEPERRALLAQAPLKVDQRVSTPQGFGTVTAVDYLKDAQQWRCAVWLDNQRRAIFDDVSEVHIIEQGRLL